MDKCHKPPLGEDVYEEISLAQYKVHKTYRAKLNPLFVSPMTQWVTVVKGEPPLPALPRRLGRILGEYACALFDAEASYYPASPELQTWLKNLAESVAERVEERILDRSLPEPFGDISLFQEALTYHATEEQMRQTIREALKLRSACDESPGLGGETAKCSLTTLVTPIAPAGVASRTEPKEPVAQERGEKTAASIQPTSKTSGNQNKGAIEIRELAPGVGLPSVEMRKPAGTIARETRHAALAKGAPHREEPIESKPPSVENGAPQESLPAADARTVAIGVAQVSLADLNAPVGKSLKEVKNALLKLGAPARKLKDPRILEAADYKIQNPRSTYKEVSIKFFRTPERADSIRSWANKRKPPDGRE
jgi:hypothetical protein